MKNGGFFSTFHHQLEPGAFFSIKRTGHKLFFFGTKKWAIVGSAAISGVNLSGGEGGERKEGGTKSPFPLQPKSRPLPRWVKTRKSAPRIYRLLSHTGYSVEHSGGTGRCSRGLDRVNIFAAPICLGNISGPEILVRFRYLNLLHLGAFLKIRVRRWVSCSPSTKVCFAVIRSNFLPQFSPKKTITCGAPCNDTGLRQFNSGVHCKRFGGGLRKCN